jgi:hypothetical protein
MMKNEKLKMFWDRDSTKSEDSESPQLIKLYTGGQDWAQTIVSQSLKTADGVVPVPQQELWFYEGHQPCSGRLVGMVQFGPNCAEFVLKTNIGRSGAKNKQCYSTREALETANCQRDFLHSESPLRRFSAYSLR